MEETQQTPELYDVVIPPGVPRSIIREIIRRFPGELVDRMQRLKFANMDGDERELIAFRTDLATAQAVEQYLYDELKVFIGEE
ncbi:MAG TPA: hypothetical protein PK089_01435 [Methanoregulaceae archaeon]|nr:hypothetical protein [Methanoregulaceae archaeon]HOV66904.1 hypothetical protein [Methanoregulaceae archaeon]HQJ87375.1 hypothetical protein [Methanoregulaceae archaeon]